MYAAELNYNKHQDLLINVVNLLKDKIPNIKLLLAGTGKLRKQYEEQIRAKIYKNMLSYWVYEKIYLNC